MFLPLKAPFLSGLFRYDFVALQLFVIIRRLKAGSLLIVIEVMVRKNALFLVTTHVHQPFLNSAFRISRSINVNSNFQNNESTYFYIH
jgi:hypothetical protein